MFKKTLLLFSALAMVISACGTLEMTVYQTPTPKQAATTQSSQGKNSQLVATNATPVSTEQTRATFVSPTATLPHPQATLPVPTLDATANSWEDFEGSWYTNVAVLTLQQNGSKAMGSIKGYGDQWNEAVGGNVNGSILSFDKTSFFGDLEIELSTDGNSFKSANPELSFCGVRKGSLPTGCGFSGKWYLKTDIFPQGSYMVLLQTGYKVNGKVYTNLNKVWESVSGEVEWGKGWRLKGKGTNHVGDFTLEMTANEKAFNLDTGGDSFNKEWCGLRENESQVWASYFWCKP
jgi:hypothetical protein